MYRWMSRMGWMGSLRIGMVWIYEDSFSGVEIFGCFLWSELICVPWLEVRLCLGYRVLRTGLLIHVSISFVPL